MNRLLMLQQVDKVRCEFVLWLRRTLWFGAALLLGWLAGSGTGRTQPGGSPATPAAGTPALLPPSLPSTLPGGMPLPNLPGASQQEILQRILDAAGGRPPPLPPGPLPVPAAPSAMPSAPQFAVAPAADPPSNTEAFFAERLGQALRQFGYDSFRA
jgi:hypothetical protein